MRNTIIVVVVIVLLGGAYWVYSSTRPAMTLEVVSPRSGTIRSYIEEQAVTKLPSDTLVAMPIAGWLQPIDLREGDAVTAGQVVAQLDTDDLDDRVRQAQARIARLETKIRETEDNRLEQNALTETEATVTAIKQTVEAAEAKLLAVQAVRDFAESEVTRLTEIAEQGAANDRELREATTNSKQQQAEYRSDQLELAALKTIEAVSYIGPKFIRDYIDRKTFTKEGYERELEEARVELQIVQRDLKRTQITSPIDGVVLERLQTRRQYLSPGTPLLTLGRLDDLEVIAEVLTEQATRVRTGDPVEVFGRALTDGAIAGKVSRVYPAGFTKVSSLGVEQQRVNVAVTLDKRPEFLGVGFRVYVRIFDDQADDALIVPRTALFRSPTGEWQAMAIVGGRTQLRIVQVGLMNDDEAQILKGLTAKDVLVARPSRDIGEGLRVATVHAE